MNHLPRATGMPPGLSPRRSWYSQGSQHPPTLATSAHSPATSACAAAAPRTPPPQRQPGSMPGLPTKNQARCCQAESRMSCNPSCDRSPRHTSHGLGGDLHPGTRWGGKRLSSAVGGARLVMDHGTVGRLLPTRAAGLGKHGVCPQQQREPSWEGASVAQTTSSCSQVWLSIPSSLTLRKVQQPPGPRSIHFSTSISGTTTCTEPHLPGVPYSQWSRGERVFSLQELSHCP